MCNLMEFSKRNKRSEPKYIVPEFNKSVLHTYAVKPFGPGVIGLSQTSDGIVGLSTKSKYKLKLQVRKPSSDLVYNYDVPNGEGCMFIPVNMEDGTYKLRLMQSIQDNQYKCIAETSTEVTLADEFQPYLRPSQMVDYNENSDCVQKGRVFAAGCTTGADVSAVVWDYRGKNVKDDTEKSATVQNGYLPSPDETLKIGKGICFDYASLAAAMLRSVGIPCKLITGYVGEETYHAWNSIYLKDKGWSLFDTTRFLNKESVYTTKYTY